MYKLPPAARELVLFQRTDLLPKRKVSIIERIFFRAGLRKSKYNEWVKSIAANSAYDFETKYFEDMAKIASMITPHLPPRVKSILDIGCGVAALDLFLDRLALPERIILLDKTQTDDNIWYGFKKNGSFYSSLELAKDTLELNGVDPSKVELMSAPRDGLIGLDSDSIDFVVSTISWGFHYPIGLYIDSVHNLLKNNGVLIVDVRKGSGGFEELTDLFEVIPIWDSQKYQTLKCMKKTL